MNRITSCLSVLTILVAGYFLIQCSGNSAPGAAESVARAQVEVTYIQRGTITDSVNLSATTYFPKKSVVTAPITGYITSSQVQPGMQASARQLLFTLRTREASTLETNIPDSLFPSPGDDFGSVTITAQTAGSVINVSHYQGDYVQEGAHLCTVVHPEDLAFKLFVPYRYHGLMTSGKRIRIRLPDGRNLWTRVVQQLSLADSLSQSAIYLLKPEHPVVLPEGIRVSGSLITNRQENAQLLPKEAVLSNETMDSFWVMQVVDDTLALKVPVEQGMVNQQAVEIKQPNFSPSDRIITTGNYGLEDSARVSIFQ